MLKRNKPPCIIKHDTGTNDVRVIESVKQTAESIIFGSKNLNDTKENENGKRKRNHESE